MSTRETALAALSIVPPAAVEAGDRLQGTRPARLAHDRLTPNPDQPRKEFADQSILELAADIATNGQLGPILVTGAQHGGQHMIIAGERRWRAMGKIDAYSRGERLVDVLIDYDVVDADAAYNKALSENLHRDDLTRAEMAAALLNRKLRYGLTNAQLARRCHKSDAWVDQHLRYAQLSDATRSLMDEGQVDMKVAGLVASLPDEAQATIVRSLHGLPDQRTQLQQARTARNLHEQGVPIAEAVEQASAPPPDRTAEVSQELPGADPPARRGRPRAIGVPFTLEYLATGPPRVNVSARDLQTSRLLTTRVTGLRRWLEAVAADISAFRDLCASQEDGGEDWALAQEILAPVLAE